MRRILTAAAAATATVLALGATTLPSGAQAAPASSAAPRHGYIVVLDDSAVARTVARAHADRFGLDLGHVYSSALQGYSAAMTPTTAALVEALPGVDHVQRTSRSRRPPSRRPRASTAHRPTSARPRRSTAPTSA